MTATAHHLQHTTAPVVTDNTKILSENKVVKQFHHKRKNLYLYKFNLFNDKNLHKSYLLKIIFFHYL